MRSPLARNEVRRLVKMAIASILAWALGDLLGESAPVFAALVPLLAITDDPYSGLNVSIDRVIGVLAGVGLGIVALQFSDPSLLLAAVVIVAGLGIGVLVRTRSDVNVQVAVSAMVMLLVSSQAESVGLTRIWETLIGVAVTFVVSIVLWPPDPVSALRTAEAATRARLAGDLEATVAVLQDLASADANLRRVREHAEVTETLIEDVDRAQSGLRFNPRHRGDRAALDALAPRLEALVRAERHVRSLARLLADLEHEEPVPGVGPAGPSIETAASHIADALRGVGSGAAAELSDAAGLVEGIEYGPDNPLAVLCQSELRRLVTDLGALRPPARAARV